MRLSKVAKELNVGIANIVDYLASKGVKVDGRPNTKITQDAYEILKQQFSDDVEQHKRSTEVAQALREEKQAIKEAAAKKIEKTDEVVKAKANVSKPKMLGKIEVPSITKTKTKEKLVNPATKSSSSNTKSKNEINLEEKNHSEDVKALPDSNVKDNEIIKAKDTTSLSESKHLDKTDVNLPIQSDLEIKLILKKNENPLVSDEHDVLRAKSETISGPKLTGQVIDLEQFKKPKKKVASSSNPSGNKDNKKKRKRINQTQSNVKSTQIIIIRRKSG